MNRITVWDKSFEIYIPSDTIQARIAELANQISLEFNGQRPVFLVILNGAFLFASDLFRRIEGDGEINFLRVSSYAGMESSGNVKSLMGVDGSLENRPVILVEDIVDSGDTAVFLMKEIAKYNPSSLKFATLLFKPKALRHQFQPDYVGFEVPNDFLVGYGLDYDGLGRNYNDIYTLSS